MHSNRSLRISCTPSFRITRWVNTQFTGNLLLRNDPAPSNIDIVAPHSRVSGAPRATLFRVLSLARSSQPIPETPLLFSQVHKVQKSKRESVKKEPVSCGESIPVSHHSPPLLFCWARCCWLRRSQCAWPHVGGDTAPRQLTSCSDHAQQWPVRHGNRRDWPRLCPHEPVAIYKGTRPFFAYNTDATGSFVGARHPLLGPGPVSGIITITATGRTSGLKATCTFTVTQ